jgi:hypothetical protein
MGHCVVYAEHSTHPIHVPVKYQEPHGWIIEKENARENRERGGVDRERLVDANRSALWP